MSIEQYKIQTGVFKREHPVTREEAILELHAIGVLNLDGTLTEEYQFFQKKEN